MTANHEAVMNAMRVFPGGVNSPVRAFAGVGGDPVFFASGSGARFTDIEGRTYIDYVGSWGPLILGHADPDVVAAVQEAASRGLTFGAPTLGETALAELIREAYPNIEKMRFVSSGTEATMSAIRVARGYTGRDIIVKCDGCYHGHADSLLVAAGSGVATLGIPGCPGIPAGTAENTLVVPFNDAAALKKVFDAHSDRIAAVILEPIAGNMGVVLPLKGYLADVRRITRDAGAVLIFDEVLCGFRAGFLGAGQIEGVIPDMTCLGKIVGGGMPLAVYGGKQKVMAHVAPEGRVYQAGTLAGNPVAVAAGRSTLARLKADGKLYQLLLKRTEQLCLGLGEIAKKHRIACRINRFGSMFTAFFTGTEVIDYATAKTADTKRYARYFHGMLDEGVYLAPSQFETAFVSVCHGADEIESTLAAANKAMANL